jgi:hypothetical protein
MSVSSIAYANSSHDSVISEVLVWLLAVRMQFRGVYGIL